MTERKKTTTRKTAAPAAAKAPARRRVAKPGPKLIRNLLSVPVHLRFKGFAAERDYRVQLSPRGAPGDFASIPVAVQDDTAFVNGIGLTFEVITQTEAHEIEAARFGVGGARPLLGQEQIVTIVHSEDQTISRHTNWDGKGRRVPEPERLPTGRQNPRSHPNAVANPGQQRLADVPGSDHGLHQQLRTEDGATHDVPVVNENRPARNQDMIPEGALNPKRVTISRGHRIN